MKLKKILSVMFLSALAVPVFSLSVNAATAKDKTLGATTLTADMTVSGNLTITGDLNLNGFKLIVKKNLYGNAKINVQGGTLDVRGDLYGTKNVLVDDGKLLVGGNYLQSSNTLDLNNGRVEVGGDFRLQSSSTEADGSVTYQSTYATLKMNDENDYLLVGGNTYIQSNYGDGSSNNDLTNGTLELKGDFTQISGSGSNFNAKENHKVIFSGTDLQTVTFQSPKNSGFSILAGTPNTNVDITGRISTIGAETTVHSFNQYGTLDLNAQKFTVSGNVDQSGTVNGNKGTLKVGGSYTQRAGTLDLNNGKVYVGGDYRLQSVSTNADGETTYGSTYGVLKMNDSKDYFQIGGDCYIQSNYGDGSSNNDLSNGTLELKGNFSQINGSGTNFNCKDKHKVKFSGTGLQTVSFQSHGDSGFNYLSGTANTNVDITAGRINKIAAETTIANFVQYGTLDVNGKAFNISGNMIQYGNVSVNKGTFKVFGDYSHRSGFLDLDNGTLRVTGDYRLQSVTEEEGGKLSYGSCYGYLKMNDPDDYFVVGGDCFVQSNWGDGSNNNDLTNGKLVLKGDFSQLNGSGYNFNCKDEHRVLFYGTKRQTVTFESPGSSGFNYYTNSTNKNVVLNGVRLNKMLVNGTVYSFEQYGKLDLNGKTLTVTENFKQQGDVTVNKGKLKVGGYYMHQAGCLDLDNGRVEVTGNYRLQSSYKNDAGKTAFSSCYGYLKMNDPDDYFLIGGTCYIQSNWGDGSSNNDLTNGTMELKGSFYQYNGSGYNFNARDNHKVLFSGTKLQTISFDSPGSSGFNILSAAENTKVDIKAGRINKIGGTDVEISGFNQYGTLDMDGNTLNISKNLNQHGTVMLNGGQLNVAGNYYHQDGCLDINNGKITVGGDYRLQSVGTNDDGTASYSSCYGYLRMNDPQDYFLIKGTCYIQSNWGDGSSNNDLTNGTLELKGDFYQINGSGYNFNAKGDHKTIFSGDKRQTINFQSPGSSGFNLLYATPNTDVDITAARISTISSNVMVLNFVQYGNLDLDGNTITISGDLIQHGNITVNSGKLIVNGNFYHTDGCLDLNNGRVEVAKDYRIQSVGTNSDGEPTYSSCYGYLKMNDANDYFLISGNTYIQSNWGDGSTNNDLTDGTLELKGNFTQINGSGYNFNARLNHKVIFSGTALQTISFDSPTSSGFNILYRCSNKLVDLKPARIRTIGRTGMTVKNFTQYGTLDLNGKTFSVTGSVNQFGDVNINNGQFNVSGSYYHRDGCLDLNNGKLSVGKVYRLQSVSKDKDGKTVYGSCYGYLRMNDSNDYFLVKGDCYIQSNWGDGSSNNDLTNGILELKGSFYQLNGSGYNFNAKDNHKVIFSGSTKQTVNFDSPGNSGFCILYSTPNSNVELTAARITRLGSNVAVASLKQYGDMNLNGYTLTISGTINQFGNISVNKGTLDVKQYYNHQNGCLDLNNGTVIVGKNYRLQSFSKDSNGKTVYGSCYGYLKMDDMYDYFIVKGNFYIQSNWGDGASNNHLTDGMLELHGNFTQLNGSGRCFSAIYNHKVHFVGENPHAIHFDSKESFFNIVLLDGSVVSGYIHGTLSYYFAADIDHILNLSRLDYDRVVLGEEASLTLQAFGGEPAPAGYLYSVSYKTVNEAEYTPLRGFSTDTTFSFTPPALGKYDVSVTVVDSKLNTSTQELVLEVVEPLTNTSTISANTITLGESVVITGGAENGVGAYEFTLYSKLSTDSDFTQVTVPSASPVIDFTPTLPGTYTLKVVVNDIKGHTAEVTFPLEVENNLSNVSTLSAGVVRFGTPAMATAKAQGGVAPYKYAFYYKTSKATKWTTLQSYGTNDVVEVLPALPGNYVVRVNIKDATGKIVKTDLDLTVENPPELKNTSTVSASEIMLGQAVTVRFQGQDGVAPYQFAVYYKQDSKSSWIKVTDYTTQESVDVIPKSAVAYTIRVNIKDQMGNIVKNDYPVLVKDLVPTNTSTISAESITEGESITVNASAEGGTAPYVYSVWYMNVATSKWTKVRDYESGNVITFTPSVVGDIVIRVNVKDAKDKVVKNDYNATVIPSGLSNTSTISATTVKKGGSVTVTASALGGEAPYVYGVWYKKTSASSWTKAQDYDANNVVSITPKYAAEYTVRVNVKDASGEIDKKDFVVNVT